MNEEREREGGKGCVRRNCGRERVGLRVEE